MMANFLIWVLGFFGLVPKKNVAEIVKHRPAICNTYSGDTVDLVNPHPDTIHIYDIAHALANNARYAGHTSSHYSVGQHSVLMAQHVYKDTCDVDLALAALYHDAAEAYLTDIPAPFKNLLIGYSELEEKMEKAIARRIGLDPFLFSCVKSWDVRIVGDEMRCLFPNIERLSDRGTLHIDIEAWTPEKTKAQFMALSSSLFRLKYDGMSAS